MICDRCGHINPNINKTCDKCGAPLERKTDQEKRKQGIVERKSNQDTGLFSGISNLSSGKKIFLLGAVLLLVVLAVASVTPNNDTHPLFVDNNSTSHNTDVNDIPKISTDDNVKENTTEVQKIESKISVNATSPVKSNQSVIIKGHLTDTSDNAIAYEEIIIKIANNEYTVQSKYDGSYSFEFNDTDNGSQSVTVTYEGNKNITSCYNSTFFEVIKEENKTNNTQNQSNNTTDNNNSTHNQTNDTNDTHKNNTHNNSSNHTTDNDTAKHNNTTDNDTITHRNNTTENTTQNNTDKHNDSAQHNQSNNNSSQTDNDTLNDTNKTKQEKIDSKLSVDVKNNIQDEKTNISGILTDKDNQPISNAQIIIKIGNNTYTTHTDNQGRYSIDYSSIGNESDEIIVMYEGDDKYSDSHESTRIIN